MQQTVSAYNSLQASSLTYLASIVQVEEAESKVLFISAEYDKLRDQYIEIEQAGEAALVPLQREVRCGSCRHDISSTRFL